MRFGQGVDIDPLRGKPAEVRSREVFLMLADISPQHGISDFQAVLEAKEGLVEGGGSCISYVRMLASVYCLNTLYFWF